MRAKITLLTITLAMIGWSSSLKAQTWTAVGTGVSGGNLLALTMMNGDVYAGGLFTTAGGSSANHVAKWNGTAWSALGTGTDGEVDAMVVFNGNLIVAGNLFNSGGVATQMIAQWNGTSWSALGAGLQTTVKALAVYNNELYAAGDFTGGISKWNGTTWATVTTGINGGGKALFVYNNELYLGGSFTTAGGVAVNNIAKWNGTIWADVAGGVNQDVLAFTIFNNTLIAGGRFTTAGSNPAAYVAQWNGTAWSPLGLGFTGRVKGLGVYNSALYAGGQFASSGTVTVRYVSKWNGTAWVDMLGGVMLDVYAFVADVPNNIFYVGGAFSSVYTAVSNTSEIAKWTETATGVEERLMNNDIHIFPNPVSDKFKIEFNNSQLVSENAQVEIFNELGEKIYVSRKELNQTSNEIDLSGSPKGLYLVKISYGSQNYTKKIVVQ